MDSRDRADQASGGNPPFGEGTGDASTPPTSMPQEPSPGRAATSYYAPAPLAQQPVYVGAPVQSVGAVYTAPQPPPNGAVVAIAWIVAVLTLFYMLPWAIAATRNKDVTSVGLINLLLGWTFIGWIVALVMACGPTTPTPVVAVAATPVQPMTMSAVSAPGWYRAPDGVGRQYWDGQQWTPHRAP